MVIRLSQVVIRLLPQILRFGPNFLHSKRSSKILKSGQISKYAFKLTTECTW